MVDRYKLHEAYYQDKEIKLTDREIAILFCELFDSIDEINEKIKRLESKRE